MSTITGTDLMLFYNGKSIGGATSHDLDISIETVETTSKDTGGKWTTKKGRKISWTVNTNNLFSFEATGVGFDTLFDNAINFAETEVILTTKADIDAVNAPADGWTPSTTATQYKGKVVITKLTLNAPNNENTTYTASFEGSGELQKVTP